MRDLVPNVKGPKLRPFHGDIKDIELVRPLGSGKNHSTDHIPHGRVFKVKLGLKQYALKVVSDQGR